MAELVIANDRAGFRLSDTAPSSVVADLYRVTREVHTDDKIQKYLLTNLKNLL